MSMADFEGAQNFSVTLLTKGDRTGKKDVLLASGLTLTGLFRLVNSLEADLCLKIETTIWPHEDSSQELVSWTERVKVSDLRK